MNARAAKRHSAASSSQVLTGSPAQAPIVGLMATVRVAAILMVFAVVFAMVFVALPATAAAGEPALAETLYQDGRALMAQGRTAEACAKFEESLRVDQATGTLLNLAVCHEALGKLATAWAEFRAGASIAQHDGRLDRTRLAHEHLARIEPRLSRLTVAVALDGRPSGLRVTLDGTVLGEPAWNVATPIDPGTHVVEARAPGYAPFTRNVVVGSSPERLVVPITLMVLPAPTAPPGIASGGTLPAAASTPAAELANSPAGATRPLKMAAYVTAGVGVAALALGTVFGVRALSSWSDRNRECPMDACSDAGLAYSRRAESAALVTDIAFGAGALSLAAAGYLFYRAYARPPAPNTDAAALNSPRTGSAAALAGRAEERSWDLRLSVSPGAALGTVGWRW